MHGIYTLLQLLPWLRQPTALEERLEFGQRIINGRHWMLGLRFLEGTATTFPSSITAQHQYFLALLKVGDIYAAMTRYTKVMARFGASLNLLIGFDRDLAIYWLGRGDFYEAKRYQTLANGQAKKVAFSNEQPALLDLAACILTAEGRHLYAWASYLDAESGYARLGNEVNRQLQFNLYMHMLLNANLRREWCDVYETYHKITTNKRCRFKHRMIARILLVPGMGRILLLPVRWRAYWVARGRYVRGDIFG